MENSCVYINESGDLLFFFGGGVFCFIGQLSTLSIFLLLDSPVITYILSI